MINQLKDGQIKLSSRMDEVIERLSKLSEDPQGLVERMESRFDKRLEERMDEKVKSRLSTN
jgi:hypothetical protein